MLPFAVHDEFELMRAGRDRGDNRPGAGSLMEHLDSLPVVPVARELDVILRAIRENELRLDALSAGRLSIPGEDEPDRCASQGLEKRPNERCHKYQESTVHVLLVACPAKHLAGSGETQRAKKDAVCLALAENESTNTNVSSLKHKPRQTDVAQMS